LGSLQEGLMARRRAHLDKAPIVEAAIDFRVLKREGTVASTFAGLQPQLGSQYSQAFQIESIEARFGMEHGKSITPTSTASAVGWQYRTDSSVAQFRTDGFTFSKLVPYTTWEEVFSEARRLWQLYVTKAQPVEVVRVAVRYINRLQIPVPAELRDYLEAAPALPPPSPQRLRQFLCRIAVDDPKRNASAVVIQASEPLIGQQAIVLLIDIDAFKDDLAIAPTDPLLTQIFAQLRDLKNEIFFASITERTAEMYE
jgi:uncharacterized protein (TIGR04255 family)